MSGKIMQNRELSWLKFNERVLEKGDDSSIPLYERLKFVSIFDSNLTEFFNVRVGSITDLDEFDKDYIDSKTNMTAKEQLDAIYKELVHIYKRRDQIYENLEKKLKDNGFGNLKYKELNHEEKAFVDGYFEKNIFPMMSPNIIDKRHPFPFIENNQIYVIAELAGKKKTNYLIVPIRDTIARFVKLPNSNNYILIEEIVYSFIERLVPNYEIKGKYIIRLTRNADVDLEQDSELDIDYRKFVQIKIKNRRILTPVRLETNKEFSENTENFLLKNLRLSPKKVFVTTAPLKMSYVWNLPKIMNPQIKKELSFVPFFSKKTRMLKEDVSIMKQIENHDVMLSYPYDSMETFIDLLKEASTDKRVFSIKITLYRVAANSKVINYLLRAAEEGKEVTVIVELRARFDEENNIDYSEELIQGGVNVIYGMEKYKVHTKVCLISYQDQGEIKYITHIGTGNYNENTAKLYQDMNIITSKLEIGKEASTFFNNMQMGKIDNSYNYLIQSPSTFKNTILELMDREIAKKGEGYIRLKCNSVTDKEIINKISEASIAGVKVDMIVRGICCILPGIDKLTENVEVRSIVGRYLEHARIYQFGTGDRADVYIASADLMTRNTERRVEIGLPVLDKDIKKYMIDFLDNQFKDTKNSTRLLPTGEYEKINGEKFDSHRYHMEVYEDYLFRDYKSDDIISNNSNIQDKEIQKEKEIVDFSKLTFFEKLKLLFSKK